jgi:hypothetical protein
MNSAEPTRRMRFAELFLFVTSLLTAFVAIVIASGNQPTNAIEALLLIVPPWIVLWLAGWISEGFAEGKQGRQLKTPLIR